MSRVPEWMRELAEIGKQVQHELQESQKQVTANSQEQTRTEIRGLWDRGTIERQALKTVATRATAQVTERAVFANAIQELHRTLHKNPFTVIATRIENETPILEVLVDSTDGRKQVQASFSFDFDNTNRVYPRTAFSSHGKIFPFTQMGLQEAFANAVESDRETKIITLAQISDYTRVRERHELRRIVATAIAKGEMSELSGGQFAYRRFPSTLAAYASDTWKSNWEKDESENDSLDKQDTPDSSSEWKNPQESKPAAPKSPSETEAEYKARTSTASSLLSKIFANLEDDCGDMSLEEKNEAEHDIVDDIEFDEDDPEWLKFQENEQKMHDEVNLREIEPKLSHSTLLNKAFASLEDDCGDMVLEDDALDTRYLEFDDTDVTDGDNITEKQNRALKQFRDLVEQKLQPYKQALDKLRAHLMQPQERPTPFGGMESLDQSLKREFNHCNKAYRELISQEKINKIFLSNRYEEATRELSISVYYLGSSLIRLARNSQCELDLEPIRFASFHYDQENRSVLENFYDAVHNNKLQPQYKG